MKASKDMIFHYKNDSAQNILHAEGVALPDLAERFGTPLYVYASSGFEEAFLAFAQALKDVPSLLCYSLKANFNLAVVKQFASLGAGADVVSAGELQRALQAGVSPQKIVFSGVGKSEEDLSLALEAGILQINLESESEMDLLERLASKKGKVAPAALRVNPDIDAASHSKISTGRAEDKFGIPSAEIPALYKRLMESAHLEPQGLAVHIGSQITSRQPFEKAFSSLSDLARALMREGLRVPRLDLGGGLGVLRSGDSEADSENPLRLEDYAALIAKTSQALQCPILLEPGRALTAQSGLLLTSLLHEKRLPTGERLLIVDAAMNDFLRPALYGAHHDVLPVLQSSAPEEASRIAGPVCESGDRLQGAHSLPPLQRGALLAIMEAGAYGAVMASSYNGRPLIGEVMVKGNNAALVRPRLSYEEILSLDRLPPWMEAE